MGVRGRKIEKDLPLKKMINVIFECHGKISKIAAKTGFGRNAIYNYIDTYPELQEAQKEAVNTFDVASVETAEMVLHKLMQKAETDPSNARSSAQFILKYNKKSSYNPEVRQERRDEEFTETLIDRLDRYVDGATAQ